MKLKSKYSILLALAVIAGCSDRGSVDTGAVAPLEDVLTLELTFGDKDLPDEYLLARPRSMAVNDAGDIYVFDEYKLKVFNSAGIEKTLIGRRGEGPNEFRSASGVWIGPTGLIAAGSGSNYNLYSPDNEFIAKYVFRNSRIFNTMQEEDNLRFSPREIIPLDDSNRLLRGSGNFLSGDATTTPLRKDLLVQLSDETVTIVAIYDVTNQTGDTRVRMNHPYLGEFHWGYLTNNSVVYTHTGYDKTIDEFESSYTLSVVDLDNTGKHEISIPYEPVEIPDSLFEKTDLGDILGVGGTVRISGVVLVSSGGLLDQIKDDLRKAKYLPAISNLLTDRKYIFSFIFHKDFPGQEVAQVFDSETLEHISTVVFPAKPNVIKNGYAYIIATNDEGFFVVNKYKIDPAVYH